MQRGCNGCRVQRRASPEYPRGAYFVSVFHGLRVFDFNALRIVVTGLCHRVKSIYWGGLSIFLHHPVMQWEGWDIAGYGL